MSGMEQVGEFLPREGLLRSRRQLLALSVLSALILLSMAVYGWILYRALSRQAAEVWRQEVTAVVERVAAEVAEDVAANNRNDLLMTLVSNDALRQGLDRGLGALPIVSKLEVRDARDAVIHSSGEGGVHEDKIDLDSVDAAARTVRAPVGSWGSLVVALDQSVLEHRVDLVREVVVERALVMMLPVLLLFSLGALMVRRSYVVNREQLERARHTEQMAYIGTLAAGLAHEIRSPLNSLSLNMQMLNEEISRAEPQGSGRRLLEITSAEIARLERLVTEFLNYGRPQPLEKEIVAVRSLVDRIVDQVRGELEARGVEVRIEDESGGALVEADPSQMHQLLLNLTENAAQATERLRRPAWIEYVLAADDETVTVQVHDNGRGMPPEDVAQATEIFYSRRKEGTGLGLAIVDRIVKSHDGRLQIESELQQGTTVTVRLPRAEPGTG